MEIRAYSRQLSLKEGEELLKLIVSVDIRRNGRKKDMMTSKVTYIPAF